MGATLGVLITYFNEKELLSECLSSLLTQSVHPDEVLIYDDASEFPACGYVPKELSVRIIRGKGNLGPAGGRNMLLRESKCDYIHFHDSDDLFHPEWAQRVRRAIDDTNADVILTDVSSYKDNQLLAEHVIGIQKLSVGVDLVKFALQGAILTPATTMRKSTVTSVGGYRESLRQSEDFDFHVRLAASGANFAFMSESLVVQRLRASSYSSLNKEFAWASMIVSLGCLSKELPPKYFPDLSEASARGGSVLFRMGAFAHAKEAFKLAYKLGRPTFSNERPLYRIIAHIFGPEFTERLGMMYRKVIPRLVRKALQ